MRCPLLKMNGLHGSTHQALSLTYLLYITSSDFQPFSGQRPIKYPSIFTDWAIQGWSRCLFFIFLIILWVKFIFILHKKNSKSIFRLQVLTLGFCLLNAESFHLKLKSVLLFPYWMFFSNFPHVCFLLTLLAGFFLGCSHFKEVVGGFSTRDRATCIETELDVVARTQLFSQNKTVPSVPQTSTSLNPRVGYVEHSPPKPMLFFVGALASLSAVMAMRTATMAFREERKFLRKWIICLFSQSERWI